MGTRGVSTARLRRRPLKAWALPSTGPEQTSTRCFAGPRPEHDNPRLSSEEVVSDRPNRARHGPPDGRRPDRSLARGVRGRPDGRLPVGAAFSLCSGRVPRSLHPHSLPRAPLSSTAHPDGGVSTRADLPPRPLPPHSHTPLFTLSPTRPSSMPHVCFVNRVYPPASGATGALLAELGPCGRGRPPRRRHRAVRHPAPGRGGGSVAGGRRERPRQ
jgi:hypothetical protein